MREVEKTVSTLPPLIEQDTRLVVLGSFPSAESLRQAVYYAHPRNQFWSILEILFSASGLKVADYSTKKDFLKEHQIGLWDVYRACVREGSLDANIKKGELNDLTLLAKVAANLKVVAHNGKTSGKFLKESQALGVQTVVLPSTSPAYAGLSLKKKVEAWREAFVLAGLLI